MMRSSITTILNKQFSLFFLVFVFCIPVMENVTDLDDTPAFMEVPVMKLNFYLMSHDKQDDGMFLELGHNVEFLNQEFEGFVHFEINNLFTDENGAYLPDIYSDFYQGSNGYIKDMVDPIEEKGAINVFVFPTYCEENTDQALMGFTPVFKAMFDKYSANSPTYDRIFIAYDGLIDKTTLVHEMGHFFGQKHPWEITESVKRRLGLKTNSDINRNHMNYSADVSEFTYSQLREMQNHALKYRKYLADKVIRINTAP